MKDLTQGPISRLLLVMSVPMAVGMLFQTLYLLVDLYFVARLGDAAIAGVSSAATVGFVILALTQMLGVGTVARVSHAVGRKDQDGANLVFNQSVLLSAICGALTLGAGFLAGPYAQALAAAPPPPLPVRPTCAGTRRGWHCNRLRRGVPVGVLTCASSRGTSWPPG